MSKVDWSAVGTWLQQNAGMGAALVGSLVTGNVPGAVAAGVSLVSSATGTNDPTKALEQLQTNPESLLRLRELANQEAANIRAHIQSMEEARLLDMQAEHKETQETIRAGDRAEDWFVRRTRPGQSWVSLIAAIAYVFYKTSPDEVVLGLLLTLPWTYAGLREVGKGINSWRSRAQSTTQ